jgi:hypothetical protein
MIAYFYLHKNIIYVGYAYTQGTDIFTLAKLMGHESTAVLQRYLKQTNQDTEQAHRLAGPVDNAGL